MEKTVKTNALETLIEGQKPLLEHYMAIEGWPMYPWDLNDRKNQKEFKVLISRMVEEFSEAYNEIVRVFTLGSSNDILEARKVLKLYNEELGDAWHFFIEVLIFSGMDLDNLEDGIEKFLEQYPQYAGMYIPYKPLRFFMDLGRWMNQQSETQSILNKSDRFIIATEVDALEDPLLCGGRRISEQLIAQHSQLLWHITHWSYKVANELKNRTWKKQEMDVNMIAFRENMIFLCIAMGRYLDFIGMGEIALVNIFNYKKEILNKRIQGGY